MVPRVAGSNPVFHPKMKASHNREAFFIKTLRINLKNSPKFASGLLFTSPLESLPAGEAGSELLFVVSGEVKDKFF